MPLSAEVLRSIEGTCEDPRLIAAGYLVCGSGGDTRWHWQEPNGKWHDYHPVTKHQYKSEYAAVNDALRHFKQKDAALA